MSDAGFHAQFLVTLDALRHGAKAGPAWQVYANTGLLALVDALRANYPGLRRLLGEEAFDQLAAAYTRAFPARDGRLFLYGADLPDWLRGRDGADSAAALAATLDRLWTEAHSEADAPPLAMDWIARQGPQALAGLRLRPAPSTRWLSVAGVRLWEHWQVLHQSGETAATAVGDHQTVLLTRPDDAVQAQAIPAAGAILLQACADGLALLQALQAASGSAPQADPQHVLAMLFGAGAFQQPDQFTPRALT